MGCQKKGWRDPGGDELLGSEGAILTDSGTPEGLPGLLAPVIEIRATSTLV